MSKHTRHRPLSRIRLSWIPLFAAALLAAAGCSSGGSKYVERTGWNPFAKSAPRPAARQDTVLRGQSSYLGAGTQTDTPQYSGSYGSSAAVTAEIQPSYGAPTQGTSVYGTIPTADADQTVQFSATQPATQEPTVPGPPQNTPAVPPAESAQPIASAADSVPPLPEIPDLPFLGETPFAQEPQPDEEVTSPPESAPDFPEFARNAYADLEDLTPSGDDAARTIDPKTGKAIPNRVRESLAERQRAEEELEANYRAWAAEQERADKEKSKLPRYLRPLSDDREVFEHGPFARSLQEESQQEHKFIRSISAADLNMMSQVSSDRELMDWEKEQDGYTDWSKYSAGTLYNKFRGFLGMGPDEKEAYSLMAKACAKHEEYEKTKDVKALREAAELYEKASKKWPDSLLEEDALFYAAECHFFAKEYTKALTLYKALITKFSNSVLRRDAAERLYWLGCYWLKCYENDPKVVNLTSRGERPKFSDFAGAKKAFETIFMNDVSDQGRAPDALFALANGYMRRGVNQGDASFDSAARYYQQLYEFYPACKHVDKAYQLAMLALYMSYRGPLYDSTPLKRAREIAEAAQKAGKGDKEVIADQLRLIRKEQARYLLTRGEYYERQQIYASARSYYNQLVNEYPESEYAVEAAQRYEAIEARPAEVDQFAFIRPVMPFLPKSKNKYYEEHPSQTLEALALGKRPASEGTGDPDFTALDNSDREESGREKPKSGLF
ncbi:MAG: tetratricopeptide repeat protein [Thermoguttaceae bacterium]|nr:tetratricopeptide repeat protein [Thermoguttaceae bacterium]